MTRRRGRLASLLQRPTTRFRARASRRLERRLEAELRSSMDMQPIRETSEEDVFLVGFPKSGNTWLQTLAGALVYEIRPEAISGRLVHGLVPDVHAWPYYVRWQTPMYFKSHAMPRPEYRNVVYLIRDGRDAMVSYRHFRLALGEEEVDLLDMVQTGNGLAYGKKWHEHVESWLSNPYGARMITMTFEDLKRDCVGQLRRLCEFAGLERSEPFIEAVARGTSFAKMRQKEDEHGWPRWPEDRPFVRRGQVGSHRDEMSAEVRDAFEREARATLRKCGYA